MRAAKVLAGVVVTVCMWASSAQAQTTGYDRLTPARVPNGEAVPATEYPAVGAGLSDWITYRRNNCCDGQIGGSPPIGTEFFLRAGPSFATGSDTLDDVLETGWMIQFGARAQFFNFPMDSAWTVDVSLSNNSNRSETTSTILLPRTQQNVTIREWNRTMVNVGGGKQWYLLGPATSPSNLRLGVDAGGRYGSGNLETAEQRHNTDVIGGAYAAVQADVEFPCCCCCCTSGCCTFIAGVRLEYAYTWSDILEQESNMQDVNVLLNFGVRY